jgi:segregation and condensation protein B
MEIIELDGAWQMCTRKEYYPQLITLELTPKKPHLTDVVMETLSVIAYKQPVTKAEIERIRGVNSDHAVNKLIEYHLVTELGRAKQPGRPILFGTTQDFLRAFGVSSPDTLPEISPVTVADFREEAEAEAVHEESEGADESPEIDRGEIDESTTIGV